MKKSLLFLAILLAAFCALPAQAQKQGVATKNTIYLVGYATSFKDSVVYITTVQACPLLGKNTQESRAPYYKQWSDYLNTMGVRYPICALFHADSEKSAAKLQAQLLKQARKERYPHIIDVPAEDFTFAPVLPVTATPAASYPTVEPSAE